MTGTVSRFYRVVLLLDAMAVVFGWIAPSNQWRIPSNVLTQHGHSTDGDGDHGRSEQSTTTTLACDDEDDNSPLLNSDVAAQFRVLTCSATSCSKMRQRLNLDEYATFSAFYRRAWETSVVVEETSCLGRCKQAPCVGIEHEDYDGNVSLEGMTRTEFSDRVFQNVVDENDVERVWSAIVNAIQKMAGDDTKDEDAESGGEWV
ncbi:hypothetical protein ACA910_021734 [Epithemia clementina (nom. ined.)]